MKNIEYLVGNENISTMPLQTFGDAVCRFASEFSEVLMKSPEARVFPDILALAFWCRRGNIAKMRTLCNDADQRVGRGVCFHVTPSNIPVNFAFSFLFGLLSGNTNIVRLPSKNFPQVDPICEALKKVIEKYPEMKKRIAFVRYPTDCGETERFSALADVRMIWGGDHTIANLKSMPTGSRCLDIAFADRYSICLIDGNAVLAADQSRVKRLAEDFYNDTWLMDQNACSSPQLILWENDSPAAREYFWNAVYEIASSKYMMQPAVSVDKYTHMCEDAIDGDSLIHIERYGGLLYRAQVKQLYNGMENMRGNSGYFYEYSLHDRSELTEIVNEKYQTLTYFGIDAKEFREWVIASHLRGFDRIVPIGKAMDIGVIWDGYDIVRMLSRIINVENSIGEIKY